MPYGRFGRGTAFVSKGLEGVAGLEPAPFGLENPSRPVPSVWHHASSLGYGTSHSGHETQFGREYAPIMHLDLDRRMHHQPVGTWEN